MYCFLFIASLLVYQVKGISSLPVMGANGSLLLDFAGIAKKVQIITCARSATCRIALITGARLNALTRAGAKELKLENDGDPPSLKLVGCLEGRK